MYVYTVCNIMYCKCVSTGKHQEPPTSTTQGTLFDDKKLTGGGNHSGVCACACACAFVGACARVCTCVRAREYVHAYSVHVCVCMLQYIWIHHVCLKFLF